MLLRPTCAGGAFCLAAVAGRARSAAWVLRAGVRAPRRFALLSTSAQGAQSISPPSLPYRTATCGELRARDAGRRVVLSGWVGNVRPVGDGLAFVALRDAYGQTQVVADDAEAATLLGRAPSSSSSTSPLAAGALRSLRLESVVQVEGVVRLRPSGLSNAQMGTGEVEVVAERVAALGPPPPALPLLPSSTQPLPEETRLRHRHLDLRRDVMQRNLRFRSLVSAAVRRQLLLASSPPFVEVDTPTLFRSTPEGAREFLVPTRQRGKFYALVQSPQQYKQLLMVGGLDRYFQLARCYRDEGGRADRQPEFTQLDLEMALGGADGVMETVEGIMRAAVDAAAGAAAGRKGESGLPAYGLGGEGGGSSSGSSSGGLVPWEPLPTPLPRVTYAHAMAVYGSDKPDRRVGMPIADVTRLLVPRAGETSDLAPPPALLAVAAAHGSPESRQPHLLPEAAAALYTPADSTDLRPLLPTSLAARAFVAPSLAAALSRKDLDLLAADADTARGGGGKVGASAPSLAFLRVEAGPALRGGKLTKELSAQAQARLVEALGARAGDLVCVGIGGGAPLCKALGAARLICAEVSRAKGIPLVPHGTTVQVGDGDIILQQGGASLHPALLLAPPAATTTTQSSSAAQTKGGGKRGGAVAAAAAAAAAAAGPSRGPATRLDLFWVTDFPLFDEAPVEEAEEAEAARGGSAQEAAPLLRLQSAHHPFTAPHPDDEAAVWSAARAAARSSSASSEGAGAGTGTGFQSPLPSSLLTVRGQHYDLVCGGTEVGGGSVRIHDAALQEAVLANLLRVPAAALPGFETLLTALSHGAPPHGGFALGMDRLVALLCGPRNARTIRDVLAFPKSANGNDLLTGAPAEVTKEQLAEYDIAVAGGRD
jgi:aspartyl-tRNA synthetase